MQKSCPSIIVHRHLWNGLVSLRFGLGAGPAAYSRRQLWPEILNIYFLRSKRYEPLKGLVICVAFSKISFIIIEQMIKMPLSEFWNFVHTLQFEAMVQKKTIVRLQFVASSSEPIIFCNYEICDSIVCSDYPPPSPPPIAEICKINKIKSNTLLFFLFLIRNNRSFQNIYCVSCRA